MTDDLLLETAVSSPMRTPNPRSQPGSSWSVTAASIRSAPWATARPGGQEPWWTDGTAPPCPRPWSAAAMPAMTLFRGLADDLAWPTAREPHLPGRGPPHRPGDRVLVQPAGRGRTARRGHLRGRRLLSRGRGGARLREAGLRFVAAGDIDFPAPGVPDPGRTIENAAAFLDRWQNHHPLITPALFAHSPYTCGNETLQQAKALTAARGAPVRARGRDPGRDRPDRPTARTHAHPPPGRARRAQARTPPAVHCVWADEIDLDTLAGAALAVVSCPQSNAKLASGVAPLGAMLATVCASAWARTARPPNNSLDLFREMRLAAGMQTLRGGGRRSRPGGCWRQLQVAPAIGLDAWPAHTERRPT